MAADKKQHGLGFICPRDNPILSTPSTNSNTISLSPRLLRKFGRGRGNRTPGGPCERTPVFRTGDFSNSSTPLRNLADTAGLEPVRFAPGQALRPRAAVFEPAVSVGSATRANLGVPTGIRTRTLAHGALNAACMPVPASARTFSQAQSCRTAPNWSARRDSNPHRACARCVLSAVRTPVPPRAETCPQTGTATRI